MKELCCSINPCYVCEPCGFRECDDHWKITLSKRDFHFKEVTDYSGVCRATNKLVARKAIRHGGVIYYCQE